MTWLFDLLQIFSISGFYLQDRMGDDFTKIYALQILSMGLVKKQEFVSQAKVWSSQGVFVKWGLHWEIRVNLHIHVLGKVGQ